MNPTHQLTPIQAQGHLIQQQVLSHLSSIIQQAPAHTVKRLENLQSLITHAQSQEEVQLYYRAVQSIYRELAQRGGIQA